MATYMIAYDLSVPSRNYGELYRRLRAYGDFAQITASSCAIGTNDAATAVRDNLLDAMDGNDKLFVSALTTPAAWYGLSTKVSD